LEEGFAPLVGDTLRARAFLEYFCLAEDDPAGHDYVLVVNFLEDGPSIRILVLFSKVKEGLPASIAAGLCELGPDIVMSVNLTDLQTGQCTCFTKNGGYIY
jgi:hypothetical protein